MSKHQPCAKCRCDFVGPDTAIGDNLCRTCHAEIHGDCEARIRVLLSELRATRRQVERMGHALRTVPFIAYGLAQDAGCDPNGAWDMFYDSARAHIDAALADDIRAEREGK